MRLRTRCAMALALCAALVVPPVSAAPAGKQVSRPKLVVVLIVDQMRADYVDKFRHQWTRGLHRLLQHGAWFQEAAYPYLKTHTCAGHATISTGAFPATHGIVGNAWWDRRAGKAVACAEDPHAQAISYGAAVRENLGPFQLMVPTLADELRAQLGEGTRVVAVSLKARSAIMLAGHRADAATWYDEKTGAWVTSSAYASAPVSFVSRFVKAHPVEADFGKQWTRALPEDAYAYPQPAFGARPPSGWDARFPHVLKGAGDRPDAAFYRLWAESPFSDACLERMAEAAVDALGLGKGRGTDFLAVSFTALDYVGHSFGPFSQEVEDVLVRLDATIGSLLDHLDRVVGADNYVVALSADHGVAPIPEQMARFGIDAGRLPNTEVKAQAEKALEMFLGPGQHVAQVDHNDLTFLPETYQKLQGDPAAMQAVMDAILSVPGVSRVLRGAELGTRPLTADPVVRAAEFSYFAERSGDLIIVSKPYWVMADAASGVAVGGGTNHSSAYAYDQRVPVILMGQGIRPGEYLSAATPADIAPTLAFLCSITLPRPDGRVLTEALVVSAPQAKESPGPKRGADFPQKP